jgi:hypothetical protein
MYTPTLTATSIGGDIWVAATNVVTDLTFTNASGSWQSIPLPNVGPCTFYRDAGAPILFCGGAPLELNPGCLQ